MDINKLECIALECRANYERSSLSIGGAKFPHGWCGEASKGLASLLCSQLRISVDYTCGENGGMNKEIYSHAWLEVEGIVLDITADQFNDRGYNFPTVYVGKKNEWYNSFDIDTQSSEKISP